MCNEFFITTSRLMDGRMEDGEMKLETSSSESDIRGSGVRNTLSFFLFFLFRPQNGAPAEKCDQEVNTPLPPALRGSA
jgi:hypothetical protein